MMQSFICPKTNSVLNIHIDLREAQNLLSYFRYIISEFDYDDYSCANIRSHLEHGIVLMTEAIDGNENNENNPPEERNNGNHEAYRFALNNIQTDAQVPRRTPPLTLPNSADGSNQVTWGNLDLPASFDDEEDSF